MSDTTYTLKEVVEHFLKDMKGDLKEIKMQTIKTNGRVNSLEKSRVQVWTAISILTLLGAGIISLAIMAIDSKIDKGIRGVLAEYDIKMQK